MVEMLNSRLHGCCLADSVGLGKTVTTLVMIQHRHNLRRAEPAQRAREAKFGLPKPILIVLPHSLVLQWANEINKYLPQFRVVIYHGTLAGEEDETRCVQRGPLTRTARWFDRKDEKNSETIIVASYGRIVSKHGPTELKRWRITKAGYGAEAADRDFAAQDPEWPNDLRDCFQMVIADEAHYIKSAERSNTFVAISWFRSPLKIAITATPTINRIDDFSGIINFLEPEGLWHSEQLASWNISPNVNPFQNQLNGHPAAILRCTVKGFNKFVVQCPDERRQADRLEKVYSICVLKRNYASRIPFGNGTAIGADIPPMQVRTVELKFTADELKRYTPMHNIALSNLTKVLDDGSGKKRVVFDMRIWRSLTHFSTWLGFEYCLHIKSDALEEYRSLECDIQDLVLSICANNPSVPEPQENPLSILKWVASSSPKLRYFSYLVAEICIKQKEKLLVWVGAPLEQKLLEDFLRSFHIDVQSIHAGMPMKRRQVVVDLFHNDESSPTVLICTYLINSFGLNLHGNCRNTLLFSPAPSQPVEQQAIGRIRRIGQKFPQRVWRLYLRQSWDEWVEGNALVKFLPTLMADMSNTMFTTADNNPEEVVDVDKFTFVRRFILVDNVLEFGDESTESPLAPEDIAKEIAKVLHGQGSIRKKIRKIIVANDTTQDAE